MAIEKLRKRYCYWACKKDDWYTTSCDSEIEEGNLKYKYCPHCSKILIPYYGDDPYRQTGKSVLELMGVE